MSTTTSRKRSRITAATATSAALLVSLSLAGCSQGGTVAASGAKSACANSSGAPATIAFVPGTTGDPFYITMHEGIANEAKKLGVKLIYQGAAQWDPAAQTPILSTIMIQKPDALILVPNDVTALNSTVQKFVDAKIPVVTVDNTLNGDALLKTRVTSKNAQGGALAADRLAKLSGGKGAVMISDTAPNNSTVLARANGFIEELKKYPGMKIVAHEYDQDDSTKAAAQVQSAMLAHPDLVGVFGVNLSSTIGAGNAVASSHKTVPVVGYDAAPAEVALLKKGTVDSLVIQPPAQEGATALDAVCEVLAGKSIPKSYVLDNVIATKDNISDPSITKYFYTENFNS